MFDRLSRFSLRALLVTLVLCFSLPVARGEESFAKVVEDANKKLVKVFGAGGFRGFNSYCTGILVSADGYILTVSSTVLQTNDLKIHTADGQLFNAELQVTEPELDLSILKIKEKVSGLPHFDIAAAAKGAVALPGTHILGLSNHFEVATRDEPVSVLRGVVAAYSKLRGRRGIFQAPYDGDVYFVDAITNNPGGAGGILINRRGELLGIIGKELRNTLSDTWINYAIPVQAVLSVKTDEGVKTISVVDFVEKAVQGKYTVTNRIKRKNNAGGYHGIVMVPSVVEKTPPYIEEILPASPAEKAGLQSDDLIVYADGEQVISISEFNDILNKTPPGSEVRLEVRRGDKLKTIVLKMASSSKPKP